MFSSAAGGAYWPIAIHCPSLGPFPSIGGGAHQPHHPVTFLFLPALSFPLHFPFLSLGLSLHRPWCPLDSHHSFAFHSLGRLCQRSPRTCPVSFLRVESTQRRGGGGYGEPLRAVYEFMPIPTHLVAISIHPFNLAGLPCMSK